MEQEPLKPWEVAAREKQAKASTEGKKPWEIAAEQKKAASTQAPPPPGKPQAPPASQGGAGAPSTTAVTPQVSSLRPSAPATEPVRPTGPEAQVPIFTPGTEQFATKSPLLPSQKPDAAKQFVPSETTVDAGGMKFTKGESDPAKRSEYLAEQDKANRQASYYMAEYADLDQKALEERKKMLQGDMAAMQFMQKDLEVSARRLQQKLAELSQRRAMIESMPGKDQEIRDSQGRLMDIIKYNDVVDQYNAEAKAFTREYKALEIQEDILKGLAQKGEMDQDAIVRREFDIKAGIGNRPAGMAYSFLNTAGKIMSGMAQIQDNLLPDPGEWIMDALGTKPDGFDEWMDQMKGRLYDGLRAAPVKITGIDQFVTPEYIQRRKEESLFDAGLFTLSEMAPSVAGSIVGGMPVMAGSFFASSYDDMGQEMQGEYWDQVPAAEKEAIRIGVATVSAGLSTMGLRALAGRIPIVNEIFFKAAQKMLPNMTAGQVRRLIDAETKSYVANLASKGVQGILLEGPEEGMDYLSEEAVKTLYENYKRSEFGDKADTLFNNAETLEELGKGLWENMTVGAVAGSMMGGSLAAASSIGARQRLTDKEFKLFKAIIGDGSLKRDFESQVAADLASGKIDRAEYDKLIDNLNTAQSIVEQIPEDMSIKATREAYDLLEEKAKLKKKDKALVGDRIAKIDEKLAALAGATVDTKEEVVKPEPEPKTEEPTLTGARPIPQESKASVDEATKILSSAPDPFTASDELTKSGLVMSFEGKSFFDIGGGRDAMVLNINGVPVPVYRSSQGTDSKERGKWYPFFAMTDSWLVKAMSDNYKEGYGNAAIKQVIDSLNSNPAFSYDRPLSANKIDAADLASLIYGDDQNIKDAVSDKNSLGIFDVRNYMLGANLLGRWNDELGGVSLVGSTKRVQDVVDKLKAKNPSMEGQIDEVWSDVIDEFRRLEGQAAQQWTVESFADAISQGQKLDSPEAQQFYENNRDQIEKRLRDLAGSSGKADSPVPKKDVEPDISKITSSADDKKTGDQQKDSASALAQNRRNLEERAKKLGYPSLRSFNAQAITNDNNTEEETSLLEDYSSHNAQVRGIKDVKELSLLSDEDFGTWSKANDVQRNDNGFVLEEDGIGKAALRIEAMRERGLNEQADREAGLLEGSKKKDNWTLESWIDRFGDEDSPTQLDIDAVNSEAKSFNSALDKAIADLRSGKSSRSAASKADSPVRLEAIPEIDVDLDPDLEVSIGETVDEDPDTILGIKPKAAEQRATGEARTGKKLTDKVIARAKKALQGVDSRVDVIAPAAQEEYNERVQEIGRQQSISITPEMSAKVSAGVPLMQKPEIDIAALSKAMISAGHNTLAKAKAYLESRGRADLYDQVAKEYARISKEAAAAKEQKRAAPPPPKQATPKEEKPEPVKGKRATAQRQLEEFPELKPFLTDGVLDYDKITLATTFDQAKAIVDAIGVDDAASRVVETTDKLPYAVSNMMGRIIAQEYLDTKQYDKLDNFERRWLAQITDMAQGLAAMQTLYGDTYTTEVLMFKARKLIREEQKRRAERSPGHKKVKKGLQDTNKEVAEQVIRNRKVADTTTKSATPKPDPAAGKKETESYGSRNKVVTRSKYEQAWKELRSQMPSGIPPQLVTIAAFHIEAGSRSFAAVAEKVIRKGGKKLLPYLKGAYKQAAKDLGVEASSDAEIDEFIAKTNTDKTVAKLKAAIASGNQKQADEAIASLQEVAKEYGLWGEYKEMAAERLKRISEQNILGSMNSKPAVEEFVLGLVRNITAQIKAKAAEAQGPKNEPKRRSDIEIIGDAYKNFERYKEVWAETQNQFKAKLRAAEARLAKAEQDKNKDAADKARADIAREQEKLATLDAYYGDLLPTPFSEEGFGRAVKEGMKQLDQKIDNIIRQHYTVYEAAKRSLTEKLVQDAGLSEPEASELAKAVQGEFDKLATERKRALIEQYSRRKFGEKPKRNVNQKALEDELILLSNTGAFSDSEFLSKYGDLMGWPSFNAETAAEIKRLADRVQTAPPGRPRFEAVEDLLAYQANLAGVSTMELVQAVWYANMLSGYETQEVNFLANAAQVMIEAGVAVAQRPTLQNAKGIARALAYGMRRGWLESGATLRTGYSPIRGRVEVPSTLERYEFKNLLKPYNLLKYVGRVMKAADVLFFETAKELRAYQWAASKSKNADPSISERRKYQELMNQTDEAVQGAKEQAEQEYQAELQRIRDEGLTGKKKDDAYKKALRDRARRVFELVEEKRDADVLTESARFAARVTYNYKPEGTLGAAANSINQFLRARPGFRYVVPFVNIIANVANESMNFYPPTAWARVARGGSIMGGTEANKNLTEDQIAQMKRDAVTKAIIGTTLMVAAFIASGDDEDDEPLIEITANGFGNWRDNETLQKSGWRQYSFKIRGTDTWVSYQYTPLILVFGLVGHYRDATKYRKEKIDDEFYTKTSIALGRNMQTFLDQTFLTSVNELLSTAIDTKSADRALEDATRTVGRMAKTLVQPNLYTQIARSVQDAFEIPNKDVRGDIMGELMKDIPVLRDRSFDRINALGEPVVPEGGILRRFFSGVDDDPVWSLFKDKGYALNAPSPKAVTVPDRQTGEPVPASEEQVHEFYKLRGSFIRKYVENNRDRLEKLDRDDFAKKMRKVVSKASRMAKRKIGFGEAEEE